MEAKLEEEKIEDWSQEMEEEKGQKIGEGALISWSEAGLQSDKESWESWKGTVWVMEEGGIQLRSNNDVLLWKSQILSDEECWKENGN